MQREIIIDLLEGYIAGLKTAGIGEIVFCVIDEKRPEQTGPDSLEVLHIRRLELLAYRDSTIYKCRLNDPDFDAVHSYLEGMGFEVKKESRNIT